MRLCIIGLGIVFFASVLAVCTVRIAVQLIQIQHPTRRGFRASPDDTLMKSHFIHIAGDNSGQQDDRLISERTRVSFGVGGGHRNEHA